MLTDSRIPLKMQAERVLQGSGQPPDGALGIAPLVWGIGAGISALLGTGWFWTRHEENQIKLKYYEYLDKFDDPKYDLTPGEAAAYASGQLPPSGFQFGLNTQTVILGVGALFALYVGSKVAISWLSPGKK